MPDFIDVFVRRRMLIISLTFIATLLALLICFMLPEEYMSEATALPVNSVTADHSRFLNNRIEGLYSDFGTPDELDRIEGAARLDTIYLESAKKFNLAAYYHIPSSGESDFKAALRLKKNCEINRSGYGELKIKVWDTDRNKAADLANNLLSTIQELYQHLQNVNTELTLQKIKNAYDTARLQYASIADTSRGTDIDLSMNRKKALLERLQEYQQLIDEFQLSVNTNPQVLLTVEGARPSLWPDKPRTMQVTLFTFFASLIFACLLSLFIESAKKI